MQKINVEIKAAVNSLEVYIDKLLTHNPRFVGIDHQIDTYFHTVNNNYRLKNRTGTIENALIAYSREEIKGNKTSFITLFTYDTRQHALVSILEKTNGILAVVDKVRHIYFVDNVKFHFDVLKGVGNFVEIEAIGEAKNTTIELLNKQCTYFCDELGITKNMLIDKSYSDLVGVQ